MDKRTIDPPPNLTPHLSSPFAPLTNRNPRLYTEQVEATKRRGELSFRERASGAVVAQIPYKNEVGGSNPSSPIGGK